MELLLGAKCISTLVSIDPQGNLEWWVFSTRFVDKTEARRLKQAGQGHTSHILAWGEGAGVLSLGFDLRCVGLQSLALPHAAC